MWMQVFFATEEARDKLTRYYEEANRTRMLSRNLLRHRLAHLLRGWADRLKPTPFHPSPLVDTQAAKSTY